MIFRAEIDPYVSATKFTKFRIYIIDNHEEIDFGELVTLAIVFIIRELEGLAVSVLQMRSKTNRTNALHMNECCGFDGTFAFLQ